MSIRIWLLVAAATALTALSPIGAAGAGTPPSNGLVAFVAVSSGGEFADAAAGIAVASPDGSGRHLVTHTAPGVAQPAWSPDGRRIALTFGSSLALVNADGSGLRTLPRVAGAVDRWPAWSPSGRLAFIRWERNGSTKLMVADRDGRRQRVLLHAPSADEAPVWSRDGRTIRLIAHADRNGRRATTVDVATAAHVRLALPRECTSVPVPDPRSDASVCLGTNPTTAGRRLWLLRPQHSRLLASARTLGQPAWSPDGTRIAYSEGPGVAPSRSRLVVLTLATGRSRTFAVRGRDMVWHGLQLSWSRDGRRIAFGAADYPSWLVGTVDARTGALERVLAGHTRDASPRWSPDGRLLAYLHLIGSGETELRVRGLTGTSRTLAHHVAVHPFTPAYSWSPDSRTIAFVTEDAALRTVDASGAETRTLAEDAYADPAWSPDATTLAYTTRAGTIGLIGADGAPSQLTAPPLRAAAATWSPDGASLFYLTPADGGGGPHILGGVPSLWTFAARRSQPVAPAGVVVTRGRWSPDGTRIYATSLGFSGAPKGIVLDLWSAADHLTTVGGGFGSWSPDGSSLAYERIEGVDVVPLPARGGAWQPSTTFSGASDPSWQPLPN